MMAKALDAHDLNFQDVKLGHKQVEVAQTKQPKRSRTGFKLSMFGLFGGTQEDKECNTVTERGGVELEADSCQAID